VLQDSLVFNFNEVTKLFELCNSNRVYVKKLADFYKTFDTYGEIVHSMLKAVVHNVSCTSNPCQISFDIFFYSEESIILPSSFHTSEVGVTVVCTKPNNFFFKLILLKN